MLRIRLDILFAMISQYTKGKSTHRFALKKEHLQNRANLILLFLREIWEHGKMLLKKMGHTVLGIGIEKTVAV